ncbi:Hypothetical predicted protein [Mytilus galloprovincialis]|uniref:Uncharacterized protein n=1 Tax=Mytilus galloprovincialis TaxID=29158 RepID=A0A8B6CTX6_MYTGA|nr:Hypothetical predicted protein [Mytilus galloprovincialis]
MEKKGKNMKIPKKGKIGTEKSFEDTVSESDFVEDELTTNKLDEHRKALLGNFGKDILEAAVDVLRDEFMQIAIEGGRYGAKLALLGKDLVESHKQEIEKKESELFELKREKRDLENELQREKVKNDKLEATIKQKEREIKKRQDELDKMKRLMKKKENDLASEQRAHNQREDALKSELQNLKTKYNDLSGKHLAKKASGNIAKEELSKLRKQIIELEQQLEQANAKKKVGK